MVEELAYDPLQVHSPGWIALGRKAAAQLGGVRFLAVREHSGKLIIAFDPTGLPPVCHERYKLAAMELMKVAQSTCQQCGHTGSDVLACSGTPVRLCRMHRASAGRATLCSIDNPVRVSA